MGPFVASSTIWTDRVVSASTGPAPDATSATEARHSAGEGEEGVDRFLFHVDFRKDMENIAEFTAI